MLKRFLSVITILLFTGTAAVYFIPAQPHKVKPKFDRTTSAGLEKYLFEQKKIAKTRPKFDKPDKAAEEENAMHSEVGKKPAYKGSWRFRAIEQARQHTVSSLNKTTVLNWVERGPGNYGGRTRSIVVHPTNANIWWAGAVGGGIWKTTDAGQTWTCKTDNMPVISVASMAICKNSPDVLYAGTGEGFYNFDAIVGDGIFKSTDGGETWQQISATVGNSNFRYVNRIIVDPDDPDIFTAATKSGVYISEDGGLNWNETFNNGGNVQQIVANPLLYDKQFIAVNGTGIYKSVDGGFSWNFVSNEITNPNRIEMAISPTDTSILYAAPVDDNSGLLGFFRSADGGETWTDYGNSTNWLGGQGWYDNALVVSPLDPNYIYVGGINIYRVHISGANMSATQLTEWYTGASYPYVHADQHALVTITTGPNSFSVLAGNDGGVHYSTDMGSNWQEMNNNYNVTQYYDADRHPSSNDFIGGTQDNGTHRSPTDPDYTSSWDRVIGGDGFDCAWDKTDPSVVYGTLYYTKIYKSTDGGYNFSYVNNGMPESGVFHTPLSIDPNNSNKLVTAGDNNTVYWTDDAAANWHSATVANNGYTRYKTAISLSSSDIVWAGGTTIYMNVSTNGGQTFNQTVQPAGSPSAWVTGISTHPSKDSTAFLTIGSSGSGKIYRTRDLGQTWENINNNLPDVPAYTVLVMPFDTTEIWLGTDIGLFISYDNGASWQYSDEGLPAVSIRRLKIIGQEIVAATHGRGIWSVHRDELSEGPLLAPGLQDITVANPNTHILKLRFNANSNYDSVQVIVNGNIVDRLGYVAAGSDTFGTYLTTPPEDIIAQVIGYRGTNSALSTEKSGHIYSAQETLTEDFNDLQTTFFGDLSASSQSGFSTALLNSGHPYTDGQTAIGYWGTPITIKAGASLSYRDVAVVEPGESGSVYGDAGFYDYVTVEGSDDGDNWTVLVEPYDCRFDASWQSAYDNNGDGNEGMFRDHLIDLTATYPLDTNVQFRFKLFADANTNGWGWGIDDVTAANSVSAIEGTEQTVKEFALNQNYPNPFNPSTAISYQLSTVSTVRLVVYNALGQKVRTLVSGKQDAGEHRVTFNADGLASGIYVYKLTTDNGFVQTRKMILVR